MEKFKIALFLMTMYLGYTYSQNASETLKVDSPYRLLRGAIIKNDYRMNTSILREVQFIEHNNISLLNENRDSNIIWLHLSQINQGNIAQPAIVIDDVLINENSQRLNPVQFPLPIFNGTNGF